MRALPGLAGIADEYDGFILDLWGVIHDGVSPYPGALACLAALRDRGKRVVLLSNAPRRAAVAVAGLRALGVHDRLYDAVITSGEAAFEALRTRPDPWFEALGRRVYHLGPARDRSVFEGLGLLEQTAPGAASFVLNTGPDDERGPAALEAFDGVLAACRAAGLPMLCANPDLTVIRDGAEIWCAGALAERYAAAGGAVRLIGKPDPAIYRPVLAALGSRRERTLAIGDSLRTDIAGAAAAGIDAVWILGGIHQYGGGSGGEFGGSGEMTIAAAEAGRAGLDPAAAMPRLVWSPAG